MLAPGLARAKEESVTQRLRALQHEFRVATGRSARPAAAPAVLRKIARIKDLRAVAFLISVTENRRHARLHEGTLRLIAEAYPNDGAAATMYRRMLRPGHPHRTMARNYLIERAVQQHDDGALVDLFRSGQVIDRFLALSALSRLSSRRTLALALKLAADKSWQPLKGTVVRCGTIAQAVRHHEGKPAARMLLLLRRDPRFSPRDDEDVREATRLWRNGDLRGYIDLSALTDERAEVRAKAARFLGAAGFEAARAPLLRLARRPDQSAIVRTAAIEALGGLGIARADLARELAAFARNGDLALRQAAVRGLRRLGVKPAAVALAGLKGTSVWQQAEQALQALSGRAAGTDWQHWLQSNDCSLPGGA